MNGTKVMHTTRTMRGRVALATAALAVALAACPSSDPAVEAPELRLVRGAGGRIAVELVGGTTTIGALQVELAVDATAAFTLDEPAGPSGVPLDTVRIEARGVNRAVLFAADTRGVPLPRAGVLASFAARPASGAGGQAELRIARAVVAGASGARVDVALGPSLVLR
ncbi:hypothetical protein L6R52_25530 [Myxococcota bacterium]|nr:hypothetical protein [Myxococcota bacterium]